MMAGVVSAGRGGESASELGTQAQWLRGHVTQVPGTPDHQPARSGHRSQKGKEEIKGLVGKGVLGVLETAEEPEHCMLDTGAGGDSYCQPPSLCGCTGGTSSQGSGDGQGDAASYPRQARF